MQGYLDTLLDGAINDPKVATHYLQRAADNAERLNLIVQDLMTISRLEDHSLPLSITTFDLRLLIDEVLHDLYDVARIQQVRLSCPHPRIIAINVRADRERIRQVFVNLISNAIKYNKPNGSVTIRIADFNKNERMIEVTDTGIGIENEYLPRLFERFLSRRHRPFPRRRRHRLRFSHRQTHHRSPQTTYLCAQRTQRRHYFQLYIVQLTTTPNPQPPKSPKGGLSTP